MDSTNNEDEVESLGGGLASICEVFGSFYFEILRIYSVHLGKNLKKSSFLQVKFFVE